MESETIILRQWRVRGRLHVRNVVIRVQKKIEVGAEDPITDVNSTHPPLRSVLLARSPLFKTIQQTVVYTVSTSFRQAYPKRRYHIYVTDCNVQIKCTVKQRYVEISCLFYRTPSARHAIRGDLGRFLWNADAPASTLSLSFGIFNYVRNAAALGGHRGRLTQACHGGAQSWPIEKERPETVRERRKQIRRINGKRRGLVGTLGEVPNYAITITARFSCDYEYIAAILSCALCNRDEKSFRLSRNRGTCGYVIISSSVAGTGRVF